MRPQSPEKPQVLRVPADGPKRLFLPIWQQPLPPVWQQVHPAILQWQQESSFERFALAD
jgi:hypothetical protein